MKRVVMFNWHMYVLAVLVFAVAAYLGWNWLCALIAWYVIASLLAAGWIYDRSGLHQMRWLTTRAPDAQRLVVAYAGYDELKGAVDRAYPSARIECVDFYNALPKREPSIERARRSGATPNHAISESITDWPTSGIDVVLFAFAAHELREQQLRVTLLKEAARVIHPNGHVVLVEQFRDVANFLAFGPGFLHFYSRQNWLTTFAQAGLTVSEEFKLSPFATVFVLCKSSAH